ncbi:MAG TPA: ABC transporter permease [Chitinophagaceae bacterium]|nr:ABC transporter permease [Chitinophagaceae bacterium]
MTLAISLRSELVKSKRTSLWYLCLIAAVLAPVFSFLDSTSSYRIADLKNDPWNLHLIGMGGLVFNMMILPFFLMLVCTLLAQLEYRNNTWKQVYVSPQSLLNVFIAKYLIVQMMLLGVFILTLVLMVVSLLAVDQFETDLNLLKHQFDWKRFFIFYGRVYITVLAISAFQFWLGLRFKSFIVPLVIGISLFLAASMMMEEHPWVHANKLPYIYPLRNCFPQHPSDTSTVIWGSVAYTAIFLVLGYLDFNKRRSMS